jgi:hypothetical protein
VGCPAQAKMVPTERDGAEEKASALLVVISWAPAMQIQGEHSKTLVKWLVADLFLFPSSYHIPSFPTRNKIIPDLDLIFTVSSTVYSTHHS